MGMKFASKFIGALVVKSQPACAIAVLLADLHLHSRAPSCWTAQILDGFRGLRRCESFVTAMKQ
eukprot:956592-Pelagomonas_calceolata.AAC.1